MQKMIAARSNECAPAVLNVQGVGDGLGHKHAAAKAAILPATHRQHTPPPVRWLLGSPDGSCRSRRTGSMSAGLCDSGL